MGSGESSLPGLQTATFLLCPHMVEGERARSLVSSYKDTSPFMRALHSRAHLNLITFQRPHLQTLALWGLGPQRMDFGGTQLSP